MLAVDIIESVHPGEGEMLGQSLRLAGIESTYALAEHRTELEHRLRNLPFRQLSEEYVGLHLSAHGNQAGIALMSGEFVTWYELCQILLPLNRRASGRLVVTISACQGLFGTGMALDLHAAPFHALVGAASDVTFSDAAVAFVVFYHGLSKGETFKKAVELMKIASSENRFGVVEGEATRTGLIEHLRRHGISDVEE